MHTCEKNPNAYCGKKIQKLRQKKQLKANEENLRVPILVKMRHEFGYHVKT